MKTVVALLILICITIVTIYLAVNKKIDFRMTCAFLTFSIIAGLATANYDLLKKANFWGASFETYKDNVKKFNKQSLEDIEKDIDAHKESIRFLMKNSNETTENLEKLVNTAKTLQAEIEKQKKDIDKTSESTKALNDAAEEIALILVRATYLTMETKNEFGTDRAKKAMDEIVNDLNQILPKVIPDTRERQEWIERLQHTLPKKD